MSIASEIERLSGVRGDIFTSITNKGVTVPVGSTFSSCPSLIDSIVTGGGGSADSLINTGFVATGFYSAYRPFTATQNIETISSFEDRTESWTSAVTSQANNRILIPVPSSTIKDYWESNSANHVQSIINFYYTGGQLGNIKMTAYMVPYLTYSPEGNSIFWDGDVSILSNPMSAQIPFSMETCYGVLANNSAQWQWNIRDGLVYIGLQDQWYAVGNNVTEMEVSSYYVAVTGTTTAYPYPSYPTTTTGYITNEVSGIESFTGTTIKFPNISTSGYKNVVYDNSPEGGATALSPVSTNLTSFRLNMLKNTLTARTNYNVNSTAYSYNYGTTQTAYSGFEGV